MSPARLLAVAFLLAAVAETAQAQVSRVFVSVTGNDANTCSDINTPCRTLAGGITQVDPNGEVIVIASGSYAGGTINKSVKIDVAAGVVAFSGLPITVATSTGTVVLRGLTVKAATVGTGNGISLQSGTLYLENVVVDGWLNGLFAQGGDKLFVQDSVFRNQAGTGLVVVNGSTVAYAIDNSFFENNSVAGLAIGSGTGRVSDSAMTGNGIGASVSNSGAVANFERCEVSSNSQKGLIADTSSVLRVSASTLVRNGAGLENSADTATVDSLGNNVIRGNVGGNNIVGTVGTVALQ